MVWARLVEEVRRFPADTLHVLEIGRHRDPMVDRLVEWDLPGAAPAPWRTWPSTKARRTSPTRAGDRTRCPRPTRWTFQQADLFDFLERPDTTGRFDLVAHAFLDLVDIPSTRPACSGCCVRRPALRHHQLRRRLRV
ncbi:MAG: hypothetical protein R2854_18740 [Caldilineaceae bacterium]